MITTRIAIITDIHHGPASATKSGDQALGLLKNFAEFVHKEQPDLILEMGDRISDVDGDTDIKNQTEIAEIFKTMDSPVFHICGNHDRVNLSIEQNEVILGQELASEVIDAGDWQIVLWRANTKIDLSNINVGFLVDNHELIWLEHAMKNADKPCLVVSHVPLSGHSQIGNYYFENQPACSKYDADRDIRAILANCPQPVICLSGHVHWNTVTNINGIYYLTQQSLTETFTTQGKPAAAWGTLELSNSINWNVYGYDEFSFCTTPNSERWKDPRPGKAFY